MRRAKKGAREAKKRSFGAILNSATWAMAKFSNKGCFLECDFWNRWAHFSAFVRAHLGKNVPPARVPRWF